MYSCTAMNVNCILKQSTGNNLLEQIAAVCTNGKMDLAITAIQVKYQPGEQNSADPFSRLLHTNGQAESSSAHNVSDEFVRFVNVTATPQAMKTREIEEASSEDSELVKVRLHIRDGNWRGNQHGEIFLYYQHLINRIRRNFWQSLKKFCRWGSEPP